jgi:hypothetical protein
MSNQDWDVVHAIQEAMKNPETREALINIAVELKMEIDAINRLKATEANLNILRGK